MNWDRQALIREFGDFDWQTLPDSQGEQLDAYLDYYKLRFDKAAHHHCGFMPLGEFRIPVHYWRNQSSSRGTALMVHGYYDHVGLYTSLISFCLSQGLDVVAFDLPGHGLADGEPAAIRDFQLYDDVFTQLLTQVQGHTAAPLFAFGQSTGGAILVNYLLKHRITPGQNPFRDIFLLAPLIRPRGWRKARVLHPLISPVISHLRRGVVNSSTDLQFIEFVGSHDPLQAEKLSVKWVGAMLKWVRFIEAQPASLIAPMVVQGDHDETVDWQHNMQVLQEKFPSRELVMIPDGRHHLVNDGAAKQQIMYGHIAERLRQAQ
ncbi:MAG TPA: alpha/beta hydrolase [Oceanospirillales bacterium]|nr:lysophospholipase [Oceanospirillaceae bacterium]HBS41922.1 alpha/beta hydrolase [Oceanospirillales bacterium]|tara:strand:+ start:3158 stop:4111 length:954 start_codon:yes stop_codon:yes gene_type:complete